MNAPTEPLRTAYSHAEMIERVREWMVENYGRPIELDEEAKDRWHERCGMLASFVYGNFPQKP
jgi:hypothetical protein